MFLSRVIDINMCQIYTKRYIFKIFSIKKIIFNKYATNLITTMSQRSLRISGLILLLFEFNNFSFLIDNLNVWITGPELQPMAVKYYCHVYTSVSRDHGILHYQWMEFWSRDMDVYFIYIYVLV